MKDWLQNREKYSNVVLKEIGVTESEDYRDYFRKSEGAFDKLLIMVEPFLIRKETNMRESLLVNERLAVTQRYLATGRKFEDLNFSAVMFKAIFFFVLFKYAGLVGFQSSGRASYVSMKFRRTFSALTSLGGDSVMENSTSLSMSRLLLKIIDLFYCQTHYTKNNTGAHNCVTTE
jgi:hypothetical protein